MRASLLHFYTPIFRRAILCCGVVCRVYGIRRPAEIVQAITPDPFVDLNNISHNCCPGPKEVYDFDPGL
jgi:hypothetical protein